MALWLRQEKLTDEDKERIRRAWEKLAAEDPAEQDKRLKVEEEERRKAASAMFKRLAGEGRESRDG